MGRPNRASPAEGYKKAHDDQQARIVREAFTSEIGVPEAAVTVEDTRTESDEED